MSINGYRATPATPIWLTASTEVIAIWRLVSHCSAVIRLGSMERAPIWKLLSSFVPFTREACPKWCRSSASLGRSSSQRA